MITNPKLIASIISNLESIRARSFNEKGIKNLLIEIRDCELQRDGVLKEICHFVAHPTVRDQGICLKEIDILYFQLKYANIPPCTPVKFEIERIPKKEFEVLLNTINKVPVHYLNGIGLDKEKAISIVQSSYKKDGKSFYALYKPKKLPEISEILNCVMRVVIPSGVFSQNDLIDELSSSIEDILERNNIDKSFTGDIARCRDDLMLCILSLLQGAKFKLYDETFADSKISLSNINDVISKNVEPGTVSYNGVFKVPYMDDAFSVGIVLTGIQFSNYFNENNFDIKQNNCPLFHAERNEGGQLEICSL
jgi:hypothetical protein